MSGNWVRLIGADELGEGEGRRVQPDGLEAVAVFRVSGAVYAVQDRCTHARASLSEGWLEDHEISCPVHDGRFDVRDGRPLCFPAAIALRTFPVREHGGEIHADLSGAQPAEAAS